MSKEYASAAAGRARPRVRREPAPLRGGGSRASANPAARGAAQFGAARIGAGPAGTKSLLSLAAVLLLAVALLLRAGAIHTGMVGSWAGDSSGRRRAASPATQTIDPRLVLTPRTVTQSATAAGVGIELTAGPLLPGSNRFALRLAERGRPRAGARVVLVARMIGMTMRPITLPMNELQPGRYVATGPLTMFGRWQVIVQVDRPGAALLTHRFTVGINLPQGLLAGSVTQGAAGQ